MYFSDHRIRSLNNINQSLLPFANELATKFVVTKTLVAKTIATDF